MIQKAESGRTLMETLAVLVVMAILLLASIAGYSFLIHQYRKNQTVKQVSELGVRYQLRPIQPNDGFVDIKPVYPEAERVSAVEMKTADTETGRVSLRVQDTVSSFSIVVNQVLDDSCEAILDSNGYESVLFKDGMDDYDASKEYIAIGADFLKDWDSLSDKQKPESLRGKTKEEVIAHLCQPNGEGKVHNMSLVFGDKCPKMGASWWYQGKCWSCPSHQSEDKYGACCVNPQDHPCGVCACPAGLPVCDKDGTGQCVECLKDSDCAGNLVCSPDHQCVPCRPYTQEGCSDGKWCSSWYKCEECLENYSADAHEGYRCAEDKALCDKTGGLENWKCQEWPCAQNLFLTTCRDGESGSITKGGRCSQDVCRCGGGLECRDGEAGQCATCQCIDEPPAGLVAPAAGRQRGQACNTDGTCPCGTNENGVELTCVDNVCSCLANDQICGSGADCCSGYCNSLGKCALPSCQKSENETDCSSDSADLENCCASGTCQSIRGERVCCQGNGQEGAVCSSNACCETGFTCDTAAGKCVPETVCSDGGSCSEMSCCADQNCITRSDNGDKTCCPAGETGEIGAVCTNNNCCASGLCENGVCAQRCDGYWIGTGETKTCCANSGENGTICASNACCTSGNCVKADAGDATGICCAADNSDGATCSNNLCCASGKCTNNTCCPATAPTEGQACTVACGCAEGYNCDPEKLICVPPTCSNTEEDRQLEGAACSAYCPCGINYSGVQMSCGMDGKCHACSSGFWLQFEDKAGACCPVLEGLDLGSVCTNDSCCKSGNCSMAEGETEGHCCQSAWTWIRDLKDAAGGQCCEAVVSEGGNCQGETDGCCSTGYCRQVYTRMEATSKTTTSYPCVKWKSSKCESCHCGKCSKSTCYICTKQDYSNPIKGTKISPYKEKGLTGPYKCCEGDGDLGSPCSEECPCQGTAFEYYVDGKLKERKIETKEYESEECSCKKVPELYCRSGRCELNPYVLASGKTDYKANVMNCAYQHDFSNTKDGKCYLCPADSSFRENETSVACCPETNLVVTKECAQYKKSEGYVSTHEKGTLYEGFYIDETGRAVLCPNGSYCVGGKKYACEEGTYSDQQGATSCRYCGEGFYCPKGATKQTKCLAGFYCPKLNTTRSEMESTYFCSPGTYSAAGAKSSSGCVACPKGSYCPGKSGKIACDGKNLPGECPEEGMEAPVEGKPGYYLKSKKLTICEAGYSCPDGLTRYTCKPGTYQDEKGQADCKPAPAGVMISGSASKGEKDKTTGAWKKCPAGTYAAGMGNTECSPCPSGTYQDETGKGECKPCPDGQTSPMGSTKASQCKACEKAAQESAVSSKCCASNQKVVKNEATGWEICCPNSYDRYCQNKNGTFAGRKKDCALSEEEVAATTCSPKQYIASGKCTDCDAGHSCNGSVQSKCKPGTYAAAGDGVCTPCAKGAYQDKAGQAKCATATGNKYVDTEGATSYKTCTGNTAPNAGHTGCVTCQEGTHANSGHTKCEAVCSKGQIFENGACRKCQAHHYCPNGYQELPCPAGQFSQAGAKACTSCGDGKYYDSNKGECVFCEAGSSCANGIKKECPKGTISAKGASQCFSCRPGEYFTNNVCKPCNAGTYSKGGTVTECTKCLKGEYQPEKGQEECLKCPAGTYRSSVGGSSCTFCNAGKWHDQIGATSNQCNEDCPAGSYCKSGVKTLCPVGSYCPKGSSSPKACDAGTYQDQTGQTSCKTCPVGQISSKKGLATCTACSAGKYTTDHKSCTTCKGTIYPTKDKKGNLNGGQTCCTNGKKYCEKGGTYGCKCD